MIFGRRRRERDLDEEIQAHLRLAQQDGHTSESARREFGNVTLVKEAAREMWGVMWFDRFVQDSRTALRRLARTPASTVTMILTLALGIGAATAIFSIVDAVLLRPLPYKDPGRLVAVWDRNVHDRGTSKLFTPYRDFEAFERYNRSLESIGGTTWGAQSQLLTGWAEPKSVLAVPTTPGFFPLLGVGPALGRTFVAGDLKRECTVVLAHSFWQSVLGGPNDLIGHPLNLNNEPCTVIGVMPAGFTFYPDATSMWMLLTPNNQIMREPDHHGMGTFARLKPGFTIAAAQADLRRVHKQAHEHDWHGAETEPVVYPLQGEFVWLAGRNLRLTLVVLFAGVVLVLLIACVNVANLLLGRFLVRTRELAVRTALGCGRGRLVQLLLTESLLLSGASAAAGAALASAAVAYFRFANPVELPTGSAVELNQRVLLFTMALGTLTTLLVGFIPAWRASSTDPNEAMKAGGRSASLDKGKGTLMRVLVAAEVTLSLLLLSGAGLMIESVRRFASAPLGFSPDGLMTAGIGLPPWQQTDDAGRLRFYEEVLRRIESLPGVNGAAISTSLPLRGVTGLNALSIAGRTEADPHDTTHDVGINAVTPGYFPLAGIPVERGRNFGPFDRERAEPVAIVNEALAKKFFPTESPIGKRIRFVGVKDSDNPWLTIIGVVGDEKRSTVFEEMAWVDVPTVYRALSQNAWWPSADLIFRARNGQDDVVAQIRRTIQALEPGFPVEKVETMQHAFAGYLAWPRFRAVVLAGFAALALVLAVVGLYGVLAQLVRQRTREIGIRIALGARRADVLTMVAKQGMLVTGMGAALGLLSVWGLTRLLTALLYGVSATDPFTLGLVIAALFGSAALAIFIPARRAMRVDPMVALRDE